MTPNNRYNQDHTGMIPVKPIDRIVEPITRFIHIEANSGSLLLITTIAALILANSPLSEKFLSIWGIKMGFSIGDFEVRYSLRTWINDGLMAIFFFVIGLEVKREIVFGQLRDLRCAALPIAAALGGMIVPAGIYLMFVHDDGAQRGWGIPMATDIAFVFGCIAILGSRIPHGLRIMLLTLAIADDIGAILVIALGYSSGLNTNALFLGLLGIGVVYIFTKIGIHSIPIYAALGVLIWFAFHESGVHATIAGVIMGLLTPTSTYVSKGLFGKVLERTSQVFEGDDWDNVPDRAAKVRRFQWVSRMTIPPVEYLQSQLHPWVSFFIMPVFALANAGVALEMAAFTKPISIAVTAGLLIGKPFGIVLASWLTVRLGLGRLPEGVNWSMLFGGGLLAGIGFTMALFIAELALSGTMLTTAKAGILMGSALSAILGILWLLLCSKPVIESDKVGPAASTSS